MKRLGLFWREWIGTLAIAAIVSVATLAWVGYRAVYGWQRSAELLVQRASDSGADLLVRTITRDMRGVQTSVLPSLQFEDNEPDAQLDVNAVASAFARYPYPELFFGGRRRRAGATQLAFYSRAARVPAWLPLSETETPFPVVVSTYSLLRDRLIARVERDARVRRPLSVFDIAIGDASYQAVALIGYENSTTTRVDSVRGFLVNRDWVRQHYFDQLVTQIASTEEAGRGIQFSVAMATQAEGHDADPSHAYLSSRRPFMMLFFEPSLLDLEPPSDLQQDQWIARATVANSREVTAVRAGTRVTLLVSSISALVVALGLALAAKATLARNRLADMRSDFTAAVTHDLKTPIATIRAVSESFFIRADVDQATRRDYGRIVQHETRRLTRQIDNLLAFSRISDVTDIYTFRSVSPADLIRRTFEEFRFQMESLGFTATIDVPADLPLIHADATALGLALGNIFDNALRYSEDRKVLTVRAEATTSDVTIEVADAGVGIPRDEIAHVTQKFYRGSTTTSGGSGLGLAIALRVVNDHRGRLSISSDVGQGTVVRITIPGSREV